MSSNSGAPAGNVPAADVAPVAASTAPAPVKKKIITKLTKDGEIKYYRDTIESYNRLASTDNVTLYKKPEYNLNMYNIMYAITGEPSETTKKSELALFLASPYNPNEPTLEKTVGGKRRKSKSSKKPKKSKRSKSAKKCKK